MGREEGAEEEGFSQHLAQSETVETQSFPIGLLKPPAAFTLITAANSASLMVLVFQVDDLSLTLPGSCFCSNFLDEKF